MEGKENRSCRFEECLAYYDGKEINIELGEKLQVEFQERRKEEGTRTQVRRTQSRTGEGEVLYPVYSAQNRGRRQG